MPQIKVIEKDLSWYYRQRNNSQLTVMMPGVATFGPTYPTLVDDSNFTKLFGEGLVHGEDLSYQMAASFVKTGIDVLFWRVDLYGSAAASQGVIYKGEVTLTGPLNANHTITIVGTDASKSVTLSVKKGEEKFTLPIYDNSLTKDQVTSCVRVGLSEGDSDDSSLIAANSVTIQSDSDLLISAKWKGTYGNGISVKIGGYGGNKSFSVYHNGVLVEQLVYNFFDINDPYYYRVVNDSSSFIEVTLGSNFTESEYKANTLQEVVTLSGGKDYKTDDAGYFIYGEDKADRVLTFTELVSKTIELEPNKGEESAFEQMKDHLTYDFDVAISSGYNDIPANFDSISIIDDLFVNVVETRGNAFYLVDGSKDFNYDDYYNYTGLPSPDDMVNFRGKSNAGFNTSYASAVGPWSTSQFMSNGTVRVLPGSYVFLVRWGQSLVNGSPKWLAPAGVKRASVGNIVKSTVYPVGSAILDVWQNQENVSNQMYKHKVNPIINLKNYGYVIYGNSTLLQDRYDGSTSMLNALSVRVVSNMIKTEARNIALQLQFDQLDDDLFAQFKTLMTVYMDQLKYGGALYDYNIIIDRSQLTLDDINSRTVPVRIQISPNPAVENFIINLEISQAGVNFGDETVDQTEDEE